MINFILTWIGLYWLIIISMSIDNLCWISSSPEFEEVKKKSMKDYLIYCFRDRIYAVIKDYRDIIPAILTSFCLTFILLVSRLGTFILLLLILGVIMFVRFQKAREW